jgi:hypothetical protein
LSGTIAVKLCFSSPAFSVTKAAIVRLIHQRPAFAKLFISYMILRMVRIEEDFVDRLFGGGHADRRGRIDEVGIAHQHRREADHAVHERDQLGHLRHLDHARKVEPDRGADDHRADDVRQAVRRDLHAEDRGDHGDRHADHAVQVAAASGVRARESP